MAAPEVRQSCAMVIVVDRKKTPSRATLVVVDIPAMGLCVRHEIKTFDQGRKLRRLEMTKQIEEDARCISPGDRRGA
jgi:hypothetical protein